MAVERQKLFGSDILLRDGAGGLDFALGGPVGSSGDLTLAYGNDNAVQALSMRLRVRKGELAPLGWPIQGLGLLPQVCTSLGRDALGWQLAALAQGRQPMAQSIAAHRSARAPLSPTRILAIRNACPAAEGRDLDLDTARALIQDPAAYATALLPPMRNGGQSSLVGNQTGLR